MSGQFQMPQQMQMPMQMPMPMQMSMVPDSSSSGSLFDTISQYKWIIIAIIVAVLYMRYFKKPKEEEELKKE